MSAPLPEPVAPGERPDAPSFAEAAGQILFRQAGTVLRGKRLLVGAAVAALAPILAAALPGEDPVRLGWILVLLVLQFLVPLLAIALGAGSLHEEAEEGTLTFLFTSPVSKAAVTAGKWAGALAGGGILLLASLGATFLVSPVPFAAARPLVLPAITAALLGLAAYLGMATLLGTLFRRGYLAVLIYAFGFELVLTLVPGVAKRLSLAYFGRSILDPHMADKSPFMGSFTGLEAAPPAVAAGVLLAVALAGIATTVLVVPRREFRGRNLQG
jgi:ABC-2 type transport system permease protein